MQGHEMERVARSWILDFCFRSLCSSYSDQNREKFTKNLRVYEVVVDEESDLAVEQQTKRTLCCFLSRILDAKNLEMHYDPNDGVTPLMSAVTVWSCLRDAVPDAALHEEIRCLLMVQSVCVCLEKGNVKLADNSLQWLKKEAALPEKLHRKLSTVISEGNVSNQLLTNFSFRRLLDTINTFLDMFLEKHPSDFLLKSAAKVVQAQQESSERTEPNQDVSESTADRSTTNDTQLASSELNLRPKKKLLSTKIHQLWKPQTAKKSPCVSHRTSKFKISRLSTNGLPNRSPSFQKYRSKRKWTWDEDTNLKSGVKKYGEGKWSKILLEFEFEDRTSVMLKDRWRTLKKQEKVA